MGNSHDRTWGILTIVDTVAEPPSGIRQSAKLGQVSWRRDGTRRVVVAGYCRSATARDELRHELHAVFTGRELGHRTVLERINATVPPTRGEISEADFAVLRQPVMRLRLIRVQARRALAEMGVVSGQCCTKVSGTSVRTRMSAVGQRRCSRATATCSIATRRTAMPNSRHFD